MYAGHIVVRQRILDILWDKRGNYVDESSLNSIICRIRNKIDSKDHHYIKTIYGTGYMWIIGE
ncbi:MAG: helix-turn-helix domain-containing protein [Mediterraneibacter gnavus]